VNKFLKFLTPLFALSFLVILVLNVKLMLSGPFFSGGKVAEATRSSHFAFFLPEADYSFFKDLKSGAIDESYRGKTKQSGQLYERLLEELKPRGITPEEILMVGDKIETDINPARRLGIKTVQYIGYSDHGPSESDYRVSSFHELRALLERMKA